MVKSPTFFFFFQSEAEGKSVAGALNFDPTPDAQTLYKAMKGLGELTPNSCVNSMFCFNCQAESYSLRKLQPDISFLMWKIKN